MSVLNSDDFNMDLVNIKRLKVNKVNLVQTIKLDDDLLSDLIKTRIIYYEEALEIMRGRNKEEKAKRLIDTLINRESPTRKDWYNQFRNLLVKRKYSDLIVFLDNTIIRKPASLTASDNSRTSQRNQPSQTSLLNSQLLNDSQTHLTHLAIDSGRQNVNKKSPSQTQQSNRYEIYDKSYELIAKKTPSYSNKPIYLIDNLEKSEDPDDAKQLKAENIAYDSFKKLESIYSLYINDPEAFKESFFLDTGVVKSIFDSESSHSFMKYYKSLLDSFNIDMLSFFNQILVEKFKSEKIVRLILYDDLDELVNKLVWIHIRNEKHELANEALVEYLAYLNFVQIYLDKLAVENNNINNESLNDNSKKIILTSRFNALSHLIYVKNNLYDFKSSLKLFNEALKIVDILNTNQQYVNTTMLYFSISHTYMEMTDFDKAFVYLAQSLKTLTYKDEILIELIGLACICYSNKWEISKAEQLAVIAIQASRLFYGRNHARFIKSLLIYSNFSNEYIHDETSIHISRLALNLARKVFGFDSIEVAEAYKSLSKAFTINKIFKEGLFYEYAFKAFKIASTFYEPHSPKLIPYQLNFVSALQWRSINSNIIEIRRVNLNDAYNLCNEALKVCLNIFGESNFYSARIYRLLGSLFYYMERDAESEQMHKKSLAILEKLFAKNDLHLLLAKSTLGVFYKMTDSIEQATEILSETVDQLKIDELANLAGYCHWISSVYSNLSECYRLKKSKELADYYQRQTDHLKAMSSSSRSLNKYDIGEEIERNPPKDLNLFMSELMKD